jgi:hypothetical protein
MIGVIVGIVVVIGAISFVANVKAVEHKAKSMEEELTRMQPRLEKARATKKERDRVKAILGQFNAWNKARLPYRDFLVTLRDIVPEEIQLTGLEASDNISTDNRTCRMEISGKAQGANPKEDVDTLVLNLKTTSSLTSIVARAEVVPGSFKPVGITGEARNHREFKISLDFKPKQFAPPQLAGGKASSPPPTAAVVPEKPPSRPSRAAAAKETEEF